MRLQRRAKIEPMVPIASMGDIAFLLIIFFMLASVFIKERNIKSKPPVSADIRRVKKPSQVSVTMDEDGVLYLQGRMVSVENVASELAGVAGGPDDAVMVKIHRELPASKFRPLLMALSKANAKLEMIGTKRKLGN